MDLQGRWRGSPSGEAPASCPQGQDLLERYREDSWMNFRFGAVAVLGAALFVGGCATAGETRAPDSTVLGAGAEGDELPQWITDLPQGIEPRDNDHTNQAAISLIQASAASSEEQARTRYQDALGHAEAGIAEDPENPQSYLQAGEALMGLDRIEEAAARFDRAEELHPPYILETIGLREAAWIEAYNQGVAYIEADNQDAAVQSFELANSIYQFRPEALLNLGSIYAQQGRYEESAEAFGQVVEIIDGPWYDRVDDEEMRESWRALREPAMVNRAQLLLRADRFDEAADAYAMLVEEDPDNLEHLTAYASALVAGGRGADAQDLFADLLARDNLNASDYFTIGVGLYQVEQFEGAEQAFRRTFEVVPNHRDAVFNFAQTLYINEEWTELEQVTAKLLEIDELNALAYRFRANALLQLGREDEAMDVYTTGEDLPIVMDEITIRPGGSDVVLAGQLSNHTAPAGTEVRLRFTFYDVRGAEIGTRETTVRFEGEGEARAFEVEIPDGDLFGYGYRVMD
ncbi:MAG: tetratricopeptide repeat protein [Gemmatimonadales bacterium]|nr:MAG: tetratricopeptide repeat protein [Gemmatimonadales bacterium]